MYLLYTDETNLDPASSDFFVYGGVAIPSEQGLYLSQAIDSIRTKYGYTVNDYIKFNTRERPSHITPENHKNLKKELLEVSSAHGVKIFVSFILHNIATSPDDARKKEINRICYHFDCYLRRHNEVGLVLVDTFQDSQLREIL
ncbi:MAG: hypothetical protein PHV85_09190, partial [Desulfovibrionaceae bacterium]|nr:hypothetical protein [Desulfovibrionaceae bacterium]